jgi:hypothetical protein
MRGRRFLVVGAALLASTTVLLSGAGPSGIRTTDAASCLAGQRQAYVTFKASLLWRTYAEVYYGGGAPSYQNFQTIYSGPSGNTTFTFCVAKVTTWSIKSAPDVIAWNYYHVDANLNASGTGYLLRPGAVNATSITLQPTVCREDTRYSFLAGLLGLPVPNLAGKAITAPTDCRNFGTQTVPIKFETDGDTYASSFTRYFNTTSPLSFGCPGLYYNSCQLITEWKWTITTP